MDISLWPEDSRPEHNIPCDHCQLAQHCSRVIWGEGNPSAAAWILLDNPGSRRNSEGSPYVCETRWTLYQTTLKAGFQPGDLYLTYVLRRRPLRSYNKDIERRLCVSNLEEQLVHHAPSLLLCLGNVALRTFTGDPQMRVKDARQHWWMHLGLQFSTTYHPLAIRRNLALQSLFDQDWIFFHKGYRAIHDGT